MMGIDIEGVDEFTWKITDPDAGMRVPAYVYSSRKLLDQIRGDKSLDQLVNVSTLPGIVGKTVAMPDIHQGYGFPIGGVAAFDSEDGLVSPGGVGYDINCGVSLLRTDLMKEEIQPHMKEIVDLLFSTVPTGTGKKGLKVSSSQLDEILLSGMKWALDRGYASRKDLVHTELGGSLEVNRIDKISPRARERGMPQLMTLGAGNHFLEVQVVDRIYNSEVASSFGLLSEGQITIMIHTGSRGFGHQVATDFLNILNSGVEGAVTSPRDRQLISAHIKSKVADDYLESMRAAANFAYVNRQLISNGVMETFKKIMKREPVDMGMEVLYSLAHNIARVEEHTVDGRRRKLVVHRKGATRAFPAGKTLEPEFERYGHPVLIPGDMGSASYVLVGVEDNMSRSFGSSCHGAGRRMSRHASLKAFSSSQVKKSLVEIGVTARAASDRVLVEEAPGSYKDVDEVVRSAEGAGLTDVVARLVPVGVIKG